MLIKRSRDVPAFTANDGCRIRELVHPRNDPTDLPFSLAVAEVAPGARSYRHMLRQHEVYYILRGRGRMHVGDESAEVTAGDAVVVPPQSCQWIRNLGEETLLFAAVVAPPWRSEDDERLPDAAEGAGNDAGGAALPTVPERSR